MQKSEHQSADPCLALVWAGRAWDHLKRATLQLAPLSVANFVKPEASLQLQKLQIARSYFHFEFFGSTRADLPNSAAAPTRAQPVNLASWLRFSTLQVGPCSSFKGSGPAGWHFWFYRGQLPRLKLPRASLQVGLGPSLLKVLGRLPRNEVAPTQGLK